MIRTWRFVAVVLAAVGMNVEHSRGQAPLAEAVPAAPATEAKACDPYTQPPGLFVGAELGVFRSDLLKAPGLGRSDEAWIVSPRATLGYQFDYGGAVLATYQFMGDSAKTEFVSAFAGDFGRTRADIDLNWLDLDYRTREFAPVPWWRLHGQFGARFLFVDFDLRSENAFSRMKTTDDFFAGGPHLGFDNAVLLGDSGLALVGRADVGFLFGNHTFKFHADYTPSPLAFSLVPPPIDDTDHETECDLDLRLEAGVSWTTTCLGRWLRVTAGYQYQEFFFLSSKHDSDAASIFRNHGPFARFELAF